MKHLLGLLLVMGIVGCGGPLEKLGATIERNSEGEVVNVYLNNTQITDAGLVHLKGMTNMQNLDLTFPRITDAGVADLKKALPKCKINEE